MTEDEILRQLCTKDPRNPDHKDLYYDFELDEIPEPRANCFCDNCFYGRDRLALEILRLREEKADLVDVGYI